MNRGSATACPRNQAIVAAIREGGARPVDLARAFGLTRARIRALMRRFEAPYPRPKRRKRP